MTQFGEKAILCLRMAALERSEHRRWFALYDEACARFSEKAVCKKFEELYGRGYLECGISARTAWLTPKGREALDGIDRASERPL